MVNSQSFSLVLEGTAAEIVMMLACDWRCSLNCVCVLILFHQCIFPSPKLTWNTQCIPVGFAGLSKLHFIYESRSWHCVYHLSIDTVSLHTVIHEGTAPLTPVFKQKHTFLPHFATEHIQTQTTDTERPVSIWPVNVHTPSFMHSLMCLLSTWFTLPYSVSQTLPRFVSPPPPSTWCSSHSWTPAEKK